MSVSYNPAQLTKGARALFMQQLAATPPSLVGRVATLVPSDSKSEDYAWMGESPQMEEAIDELPMAAMSNASINLENKKYWTSIGLSKDDVEDDKVGGFGMRVRELAQVAGRYPNKLVSDAFINGTSSTLAVNTIDGVEFFSASHTARGLSGSQSNLRTGGGVTSALILADLNIAIGALLGFKGENGEPINEGFTKIYVHHPVALIGAMNEAVHGQLISNTSNVGLRDFQIDLVPNPRLDTDSAVDYYVGIQDPVLMGIIFQQRSPVDFTVQDGAESDDVFKRDIYRYKTSMRGRAGYARWQRVVKVNNT